MNDTGKRFLLKTLLCNDRLQAYRYYLQVARESGYRCCSFIEFFHARDTNQKFFILRHDVDHVSIATRKMFEVEKELGVTSTYYFRDSTVDCDLIEEMLAAGFEVGCHYETIANMIRSQGLTTKEQIDMPAARQQFLQELSRFEQRIGHKTQSCASHGATENTRLGISNNVIFEGIDPSTLHVEVEVYNAELYDKYIDYHIMDGSILHNYGFSYRDTRPLLGILEQRKVIVFLAHPTHWYSDFNHYIRHWGGFLLGHATYSTTREFLRIKE